MIKIFSFSFSKRYSFVNGCFSHIYLYLCFCNLMSIKIKPIMELSLFAIIVLLVVILYMQSDRFAKLNSEINAVKRRLDLLLEKKKEISSISETKVPPVLMENTEEEPSLPTPVKDKIQSVSEVQLPENGTESHPEPEPVSWISEEVSAIYSQVVETEKPEKETKKPTPVFIKKEKAKINYEKFIGENLFGKIGILVLVVGVGLFVKYAIDKDWINETMRTILGFVAGAVCCLLQNACVKSIVHSVLCWRVALLLCSILRLPLLFITIICFHKR